MTEILVTRSGILREIGDLHTKLGSAFQTLAAFPDDQGGVNVKTLGEHLKDAGIPDSAVEQPKKTRGPNKSKSDLPPAAPPVATAATVVIPTPEQIANDLKVKLVALVGKARPKAIAILGSVGAKKFSDIPFAKHAGVLRQISDALAELEKATPPAAPVEEDPLS